MNATVWVWLSIAIICAIFAGVTEITQWAG